MPNALLEAMAAARPVVATRVGGAAELLESGTAGLLVPPDDPCGLAEALGQLLADPALARRMGLKGRDLATSRYSCSRMADAFARLYGSTRPSQVAAASPGVVTT
jgi:glycosyltransferase involved in cell wall biosynthesis